MTQQKPKEFSRIVKGTVGGKLLKAFDQYCADEGMREGDALRLMIRVFTTNKKNPFFETDKK